MAYGYPSGTNAAYGYYSGDKAHNYLNLDDVVARGYYLYPDLAHGYLPIKAQDGDSEKDGYKIDPYHSGGTINSVNPEYTFTTEPYGPGCTGSLSDQKACTKYDRTNGHNSLEQYTILSIIRSMTVNNWNGCLGDQCGGPNICANPACPEKTYDDLGGIHFVQNPTGYINFDVSFVITNDSEDVWCVPATGSTTLKIIVTAYNGTSEAVGIPVYIKSTHPEIVGDFWVTLWTEPGETVVKEYLYSISWQEESIFITVDSENNMVVGLSDQEIEMCLPCWANDPSVPCVALSSIGDNTFIKMQVSQNIIQYESCSQDKETSFTSNVMLLVDIVQNEGYYESDCATGSGGQYGTVVLEGIGIINPMTGGYEYRAVSQSGTGQSVLYVPLYLMEDRSKVISQIIFYIDYNGNPSLDMTISMASQGEIVECAPLHIQENVGVPACPPLDGGTGDKGDCCTFFNRTYMRWETDDAQKCHDFFKDTPMLF